MTYTFQQLQQLLEQAGMDSARATTGAAVALAESAGRPDAVGDQGSSFGLWQIHLPAHPDVSQACALDPACAAAAVVRISGAGIDWSPWTTYVSGAYRDFLSGAQAAVKWAITLRFGELGPSGGRELGTDIGVAQGTPVLLPWSGTVALTEDKGKLDWGKRVLVHLDSGPLAGLTYGVGHLTQINVAQGQELDSGAVVGLSGGDRADPSSGESTGQHVEVQFLNQAGQFLDPEQVLARTGTSFGQLFGAGGPGLPNPLAGPEQAIAGALGAAALKIGYFLLAIALIWFGLVLLIVGSIPWGRLARAAAGATPEGQAAAAAGGAGT